MPLCERTGRGLQVGGAHFVRWRVCKITAERHTLDDMAKDFAVDVLRKHETHISCFRFSITRKLIAAQCKCQCSQPCVMRRIGKPVCAGRQKTGQLSRPEPVDVCITRALDPK